MVSGNRIETFRQFYKFLNKVKKSRKKVFDLIEKGKEVDESYVEALKDYLKEIKNITKREGKYVLLTDEGESIETNLDHEIEGIRRDLIFVRQGEDDLEGYMERQNPSFSKEKKEVVKYLKKKSLDNLVVDRDGTISSYAERYFSSLQAIYNAVFLNDLIETLDNAIIMSSAPLKELKEVNILGKNNLILAGSRGREFYYKNKAKNFHLPTREKRKISNLVREIKRLLRIEKFSKFAYLGSGLQRKFGSVTVARQDISGSISKKKSQDFLKRVKEIVEWVDPRGDYFYVEDTGLDINISLKWNKSIFDKGSGLSFILDMEHLTLNNALVCGNSYADLSIVERAKGLADKLNVIFVTEDKELKKKVRNAHKDALFVSRPEILMFALRDLSKMKRNKNK